MSTKPSAPKLGVLADCAERYLLDASTWAATRGIRVERLAMAHLEPWHLENIALLYVPYWYNFDFLNDLDPKVPLLIDFDNAGIHAGGISVPLAGRRVAARLPYDKPLPPFTAAPFPDVSFLLPCYGLPKVRSPRNPSDRDVIMVDIHEWSPLSYQYHVLTLLGRFQEEYDRIRSAQGNGPKIYLNKRTRPRRFVAAARAFSKAGREDCPGFDAVYPLELPKAFGAIMDPIASPEEHSALYDRTTMFVTCWRHFTDYDLFSALMSHTPVMGFSLGLNDPYRIEFPFSDAAQQIVPRISGEIEKVAAWPILNLSDSRLCYPSEPWPQIDQTCFVDLYNKSMDLAWHWALTGERDEVVHEKMEAHRSSNLRSSRNN